MIKTENSIFKGSLVVLIVTFYVISAVAVNGCSSEKSLYNEMNRDVIKGSISHVIIVPRDYPTIQDAINHANDGDSIQVWEGVYKENIVVDRLVSIIGNGSYCTIIDDIDRTEYAVNILADGVEIKGFTICNSSIAGVYLFSNYSIIQNNEIIYNAQGVVLSHSYDNLISDNIISNNNYGIHLTNSNSNNITGNTINHNGREGCCYAGIDLFSSNNNNIIGNAVRDNTGDGIHLKNSDRNTIMGNDINHNREYGINLRISSHNYIVDNNISNNNPTGFYYAGLILFEHSNNNNIHHNNFINNKVSHAEFENSIFNHWNYNYWSDWNGRGPKIIPGILQRNIFFIFWFNFDWHPSQEPFEN